ncbi:MAG TPA: cupin domain-containing protein [Gemmatimonadaceae bacterium]
MSLFHRGPLRLLMFTFEAGGHLPEHRAPGYVVIQCVKGELVVEAAGDRHHLRTGAAVVLDPNVPHDVHAMVESEMLLIVCLPDTPAEQ